MKIELEEPKDTILRSNGAKNIAPTQLMRGMYKLCNYVSHQLEKLTFLPGKGQVKYNMSVGQKSAILRKRKVGEY